MADQHPWDERTRLISPRPAQPAAPPRRYDDYVETEADVEIEDAGAYRRAHDAAVERQQIVERSVAAVWIVFGIIEGLIVIRFVLKALGANPAADFAAFIYGLTAPLVAPFVDLFVTPRSIEGGVLELNSIVALIVYALFGWLLARLIWLLFGISVPSVRAAWGADDVPRGTHRVHVREREPEQSRRSRLR